MISSDWSLTKKCFVGGTYWIDVRIFDHCELQSCSPVVEYPCELMKGTFFNCLYSSLRGVM